MRNRIAILVSGLALIAGCNSSTNLDRLGAQPGRADSGGGPGPSSPAATCTPCAGTHDCASGLVCGQFGGDSFCVAACNQGACTASQDACAMISTAEGEQVEACLPTSGPCGVSAPNSPTMPANPHQDAGGSGGRDAGSSGGGSCGSLVPPDTAASCTSCQRGGHTCQANGCYGGWWCNRDTNRCQAPPSSCMNPGGSDAGGGVGFPDASVGPPGAIGPTGGTIDQLTFAIVGDTRPASVDDTAGYPTSIITQIYQDIQGENPRPAFAVGTGDYIFASANGSESSPQLDAYIGAKANFSNIFFPTMGNHECTGYTAGNCAGGQTSNNFTTYMQKILQPLGQTTPYYSVNINGTGGAWSAKFVFVAANAWDSTQQSWLQTVMAQQTTYTFVVRHERSGVSAPGVGPSDQVISQFPYTLLIVGHTHTYQTVSNKEVIVGNGGAPITGGVNYGYVIAQQRADGAIVFTSKDYSTRAAVDTFILKADGTVTQ